MDFDLDETEMDERDDGLDAEYREDLEVPAGAAEEAQSDTAADDWEGEGLDYDDTDQYGDGAGSIDFKEYHWTYEEDESGEVADSKEPGAAYYEVSEPDALDGSE